MEVEVDGEFSLEDLYRVQGLGIWGLGSLGSLGSLGYRVEGFGV